MVRRQGGAITGINRRGLAVALPETIRLAVADLPCDVLLDGEAVGDTVGDPFKDTSSVSLNPVIKFTTLFGLLAVEIAVKMPPGLKHTLGAAIFVVGLIFVYRSFYAMRIPVDERDAAAVKPR